MSEARPFEFPRLEPAAATPNWLEPAGTAGQTRSLLSHLTGEEPVPANANAAPPEAEPHSDEPDSVSFEVPHEEIRSVSRLPPPPTLGSLIPGARSNPPPANDTGSAMLGERAEAFANAAIELGIARAATLAVLEGQLLDLAVEIAAAVIERAVDESPELHTALARAALASLGDCSHVTLRTSPDAYQTICRSFGGEEFKVRGVQVSVLSDTSIPGLGCVVDGENVRIDATVSERLRAVRRAFEEERRKAMETVE
jgi:hypothetical protein